MLGLSRNQDLKDVIPIKMDICIHALNMVIGPWVYDETVVRMYVSVMN